MAAPVGAEASGQPAKAVVRIAAVFEFMSQREAPVRAIDIARAIDLAPSTVSDLLKSLVDIGYLEFDQAAKTYDIGLRAADLGRRLAGARPPMEPLGDLLRELRAETGATVLLLAQRFHKVQVLAMQRGAEPPPRNIAEGVSLPVFGTAAGGAVLMVKSEDELRMIAQRTFRTRACGRAVDEMREIVNDFREQGFAHCLREDIIPDNWALAMPLAGTSGAAGSGRGVMVLGLGGPTASIRGNARELVALARERVARRFPAGLAGMAGG